MRIMSLAIIGTLCLGMMPCAQTADPKNDRLGQRVIPGKSATLATRPPAKIHHVGKGNHDQQLASNASTKNQCISILRGKPKPVLHADDSDESRQLKPLQAEAILQANAIPLDRGQTRSADVFAPAIELAVGTQDIPATIALVSAELPCPIAEGELPAITSDASAVTRSPQPRSSTKLRPVFSPLASSPVVPVDLEPFRPDSAVTTNRESLAEPAHARSLQQERRSNDELLESLPSATLSPDTVPAKSNLDLIGGATPASLPLTANLNGTPSPERLPDVAVDAIPIAQETLSNSRPRKSSLNVGHSMIAGQVPEDIPQAPVADEIDHPSDRADDRVPDAFRPVALSRLSHVPAPVGSLPTKAGLPVSVVQFQRSRSSVPHNIGTITALDAASMRQANRDAQPIPVKPVPTATTHQVTDESIRQVAHHNADNETPASASQISDLVVGTLPTSSRRVALVAGETDEVGELKGPTGWMPIEDRQKPFAIPLRKAPQTENATIEANDGLVMLEATDVSLRSILRMIASHHKLNLVLGPDVDGPVTVTIRGARLEEVLDAILGVAGFQWHIDGNLLYVTGSPDSEPDPKVLGRRLQIYPLNYVSASDVESVVNGLLSPVGRAHTSTADAVDQLKTRELLIVEDNESGHQRVSQYLAQIDIPPRQVLIEAHVLQIDLNDEERHGVNLRALARVSGAKVVLEGSGFADESPEGPSMAFRINGTDIGHLIEAIHVHTNSRTLASPKVSVVNRQTAKVQIGQRLPYAVATTTQTATIQNVQFLDVGIVLEVTPVITHDDNILMTVLPKVSGGKITESGFPEEDTTQVETTVLMPDGSGLVIGGLIRETDLSTDATVPGFGRIPVIKHLFNKRAAECRRNELVVALVTHILNGVEPVREKECIDLRNALPNHAASELRYSPEIRYSNH